ncbi:MAG: hypothetical protein NZL91_01355 [Thermoflexales bacterium]|nr:hypothetical protein [Thermoflexales bacterium]MDW8053950.1 hypothetical protein [Anaerolineae bacterium]
MHYKTHAHFAQSSHAATNAQSPWKDYSETSLHFIAMLIDDGRKTKRFPPYDLVTTLRGEQALPLACEAFAKDYLAEILISSQQESFFPI